MTRRVGKVANLKDSPWITAHQAAEYLGVGINAIYDACAHKGLRHIKLGHSTLRTKLDWVDQWAERLADERESAND